MEVFNAVRVLCTGYKAPAVGNIIRSVAYAGCGVVRRKVGIIAYYMQPRIIKLGYRLRCRFGNIAVFTVFVYIRRLEFVAAACKPVYDRLTVFGCRRRYKAVVFIYV